jgi:hypothetical protein
MTNPDDLSLLGGWIIWDTVGNAGIALMTLLASAGVPAGPVVGSGLSPEGSEAAEARGVLHS